MKWLRKLLYLFFVAQFALLTSVQPLFAQINTQAAITNLICDTASIIVCHAEVASSDLPEKIFPNAASLREDGDPQKVTAIDIHKTGVNLALLLNINDRLRRANWVREIEKSVRGYPTRFTQPGPTDQDKLALWWTRPTTQVVPQLLSWSENGGYGRMANDLRTIFEAVTLDSSSRLPMYSQLNQLLGSFDAVNNDEEHRQNQVLLITDGNNLGDLSQREALIQNAKAHNIHIHVFMLWEDLARDTEDLSLNRLASETGGQYLVVRDTKQAGSVAGQMNPIWDAIDRDRTRATVSYELSHLQPGTVEIELPGINGKSILARSNDFPKTGLQPPEVTVAKPSLLVMTSKERQDLENTPPEVIPFKVNFPDGHSRPIKTISCQINGVEVYRIQDPVSLQCEIVVDKLVSDKENLLTISVTDAFGGVGQLATPAAIELKLTKPVQPTPTQPPSPTPSPVPMVIATVQPLASQVSLRPEQFSVAGSSNGKFEIVRSTDIQNAPLKSYEPMQIQMEPIIAPDAKSQVQCVEYQVDGISIAKSCVAPFTVTLDISELKSGQHVMRLLAYDKQDRSVLSAPIIVDVSLQSPQSEKPLLRWAALLVASLIALVAVYRIVRNRFSKRQSGEHIVLPPTESFARGDDSDTRAIQSDDTIHGETMPLRARLALQPGNDVKPEVIYLYARSYSMAGQNEWKIGRNSSQLACDRDCAITDPQERISRLHLRIIENGNQFNLRDEGGPNGTIINGRKVPPQQMVPLSHKDMIKLGVATYQFLLEDQVTPGVDNVIMNTLKLDPNPSVRANGYHRSPEHQIDPDETERVALLG